MTREQAIALAERIRRAGEYRWVGIYEVGTDDISVVGWSGPAAPAHRRFPKEQGLCGAAVAGRATVVVDDVSKDLRYLPTLSDTRSEIVAPIRNAAGAVVGLIDVESDKTDAWVPQDRALLEGFASAAASLFR